MANEVKDLKAQAAFDNTAYFRAVIEEAAPHFLEDHMITCSEQDGEIYYHLCPTDAHVIQKLVSRRGISGHFHTMMVSIFSADSQGRVVKDRYGWYGTDRLVGIGGFGKG